MKILVSAKGTEPSAEVDPRFGRAAYFLLHDTGTGGWTVVNTESESSAGHGAGVQAAEQACRLKCDAVVCGQIGPKALSVLKAGGIRVYQSDARSVAEAVELLSSGQLLEIRESDGR